ncbi:exo-alpha-sialidase [Ursidibacter maritimus]|uniref:exo-alpha-sialidase n=1 Tax=Ursidibacter maritimus TaxID=1331689 RepID=A0A949T527_9PAST|nr:exo-alpha-sialidase [Ursidibacter maritimus]KAE9538973.1 hypothetical protein A1D26_04730 [Ursidibacter maritimus]MBV6524676.1 exo-alpha-sialidase [Ursidibacter maritimus]MBV6525990.1 exo-alpha-sialidase [Ursidibacter maritimus]MBV6527905.1 exo-alpha-sialidase [Ursidibacter maritimus]MBV6528844.1 exo-alpha-sialidase [Ursidibacter maritimus]
MKTLKLFIPIIIFIAIFTHLNTPFWKSDLNENLTNIRKIAGKNKFTENVVGEPWPGIGPNGEMGGTKALHYSRIPAMTITDDNKIVVMFDLRWNSAFDQDRIDPGIAISSDGGYSWIKRTAWTVNHSDHPRRRAMDSTILYNPIDDTLYALHGNWSTGTHNWAKYGNDYFENNQWSATIYQSTDGGLNWKKNAEFSKTHNYHIFSKVKKDNHSVVAFLGGVGSGIVMRDGTLVFPIQTAHSNGKIATTILYSKDNGKTWDMPEINDALSPNNASLENMVFEVEEGKLVMTGREDHHSKARWAYYSEDLGKSWQPYNPVDKFSKTLAKPSQGSSIYVTLPNGRKVLLVSKPDGITNQDDDKRGNIALWMLDAKKPKHKFKLGIIRPGLGNADGSGYSSLAYKDGNLFVAFEDDGDIRIKNLSDYMDTIQAKALEWELPNEMDADVAKINALPHLNQGQKNQLIEKMQNANDYAIIQAIALNKAMHNLKNNTNKLNDEAQQLKDQELIEQQLFLSSVKQIHQVTQPTNSTYLGYNEIAHLSQALNSRFSALTSIKQTLLSKLEK